jgi:hypothetical protein
MTLTVTPLVMLSSMAMAQPLTFNVSSTPSSTAGLTNLGYTDEGWMRVPVQDLHQLGPQYVQPSGIRIGRGSLIPDWIDTAEMQSVSIPGLQSGGYYGYIISPDRKIVVLDPQSRRVMRVIR